MVETFLKPINSDDYYHRVDEDWRCDKRQKVYNHLLVCIHLIHVYSVEPGLCGCTAVFLLASSLFMLTYEMGCSRGKE